MNKFIIPALVILLFVSVITNYNSLNAKNNKFNILDILLLVTFSEDSIYALSNKGNLLLKLDPASLDIVKSRSLTTDGDGVVVVGNIPVVGTVINNKNILINSFDPDTLEPTGSFMYNTKKLKSGLVANPDGPEPTKTNLFCVGPQRSDEERACSEAIKTCSVALGRDCSPFIVRETTGISGFICKVHCGTL